jgi:hypothetical protein
MARTQVRIQNVFKDITSGVFTDICFLRCFRQANKHLFVIPDGTYFVDAFSGNF